jgi:hypothetical protein
MSHSRPGDPVQLGTCIGFGQEPTSRWGRLVGIIHQEEGIQKYVVRMFRKGDKDFPTGAYRTTSIMFLVPHLSSDEECHEDKITSMLMDITSVLMDIQASRVR